MTNSQNTGYETQDVKASIVNSFVKILSEHGYSKRLIDMIAIDTCIAKEEITLLFNEGEREIITHYFDGLLQNVARLYEGQGVVSLSGKIKSILNLYFEELSLHRGFAKRLSFMLLRPNFLPLAAKLDCKIVDTCWKLAQDTSTGVDFYTKRASLLAIFNACKAVYAAKGFSCSDMPDVISKIVDIHIKGVSAIKSIAGKIIPSKMEH